MTEIAPILFTLRVNATTGIASRLAIIDMKDDLSGILRLFATEGHWTPLESLHSELEQAGYRHAASFDFLPVQSFQVFTPDPEPIVPAVQDARR